MYIVRTLFFYKGLLTSSKMFLDDEFSVTDW